MEMYSALNRYTLVRFYQRLPKLKGKFMNENKKDKFESTFAFIVFVALLLLPIFLFIQISKQENDYAKLQYKYYNLQIEYAEEFAEVSTAYEFLEEYTSDYMSAQEYAYSKMQDRYNDLLEIYVYEHNPELDDTLTNTNNEFKEKLISDVDNLIDYFWNYQSFAESNPDITLSQYVKIRDIELHTRIKEYFGWTDWE